MTSPTTRVGFDINQAGPRLRRYVTTDAPRILPGARAVKRVDLGIRTTTHTAEYIRKRLGASTVPLWYVELEVDSGVPTLDMLRPNIPSDYIAPSQYALVERPAEYLYSQAAGIRWWLVFTGEAFAPWTPKGPNTPGTPGTPIILTGERLAA